MTASRSGSEFWRATPTGVAIRVRLTPRSQRDCIEGLEETPEGSALKARVRAIPESGAANAALERLIAEWLDVPKSAVSLAAGGKSRLKSVAVTGNAEALQLQLAAKLADIGNAGSRKRS